jgi:uncharacterized cysteine cluster protein YcgN (CxxCxxCC family)
MSTNSTTTLTSADIRCLQSFEKTGRFEFVDELARFKPACARLTKQGLMESKLFGGKVAYRTNAAGREEVKRAGGSK